MEIKQLKYFQTVARIGNISKASERLHIAQPALSLAIKKLEKDIALTLFDRSKKPLALTPEGIWFFEKIEPLLSQYDNLSLEIEDYKMTNQGHIRVGIPPMLGAYLFPYIFSEFHSKFPGIDLSIIEEGSLKIKRRLINEELDVGVVMIENDNVKLNYLPITRHEVKVCLSKSHPLAKYPRIPFEALKNEDFILMNEQTFMRKKITSLCVANQFEPHVIFSSNQINTILGLVAKGTGVAFILQSLVASNDEIAAVSLEHPLYIEAALAWRAEGYLARATKTFVDFIYEFAMHFD